MKAEKESRTPAPPSQETEEYPPPTAIDRLRDLAGGLHAADEALDIAVRLSEGDEDDSADVCGFLRCVRRYLGVMSADATAWAAELAQAPMVQR